MKRRHTRIYRAAQPALHAMVKRHLRRFQDSLLSAERQAFNEYTANIPRPSRREASRGFSTTPFWMLLPYWVASAHRPRARLRQQQLGEIIWGQYCLFAYFRLLDDLDDAHTHVQGLRGVCKAILREASAAFERAGATTPVFTRAYARAVKTTQSAIQSVDHLESSLPRRPGALLENYARQGAVFSVGSAAVCALSGKWRLFARLRQFVRALSLAGQIHDDAEDLPDDVGAGRWTYAAALLNRRMRSGGDNPGRIVTSLADVYGHLKQKEIEHTRQALRIARSLRMAGAERWCLSYERALTG